MSRRKTISVHDYPEHLNPFSENHRPELQYEPEPFKFHTVGRPKRRASISNAWNLFASRKNKPVEASLNLSPRLPRTSSLANNELHDPPSSVLRRKLFTDFSWLPGRRRFGSVSQQSSPSTPRRNTSSSAERYRSISLSRTSEDTVYRVGETPLITPRTHRYRAPSVNDPYKTISGYPSANGGGHYYFPERRDKSPERLYIDETPRRTRSSSLSPTINGDPYCTILHVEEPQPQALERLYIEEPASSAGASRRLFIEENSRRYTEETSRTVNGTRESSALSLSSERSSPFDEPLVPQRPPRPPRTKKRRAPLPPLPKFAQKSEPATTPRGLDTAESPQQPTTSEEKSIASESPWNDSDAKPMDSESTIEVTELQLESTELSAADKPIVISEQQSTVAEQPTNTSDQLLQVAEQQTSTSEQQTSVVELLTNITELQLSVTEPQSEQDRQIEDDELDSNSADINKDRSNEKEYQNEEKHTLTEVEKPEIKIRTKFGICSTP